MIKPGLGAIKGAGKGIVKAAVGRHLALYRVPTSAPALFLTFDDGPHPENTPVILDLLRRHNAKATFFLIGEQVERYPHLARRIREEGHALGTHTHTHCDLSRCSAGQIDAELDRSRMAVEVAAGTDTPLFRAPWGKFNVPTVLAIRRKRLTHVLWTTDSLDYLWDDPERITRRFREMRIGSGDIFLFHDDYAHTVRALPGILDHLTSQGWNLEALPLPTGIRPVIAS